MPIYRLVYDEESGERVDDEGRTLEELEGENEVRDSVTYYDNGRVEVVQTSVEEGEGDFECTECDRAFDTERGMKVHRSQVHE